MMVFAPQLGADQLPRRFLLVEVAPSRWEAASTVRPHDGAHARLLRVSAMWLAIVSCWTPAAAWAQGQLLGVVHGTVKDEQGGVLPGVVVSAKPMDDRPALTASSDGAGFYALKDLEPGEYEITAALPGFATLVQRGVLARAGRTLSLELVMAVGTLDEVVTVRRDAPLLESSSATTAVNVSGDFQRALPTSQRANWSDALILTPGVVSTDNSLFGGLTQRYSVHGSSATSHVLQIDGADVSSASFPQADGIALSTDAIADVQVKTAGLDASSPLGTGAIVNVATRSGSNTLAGRGLLLYQSQRWSDTNVRGGTSPKVGMVQPDLSLGGPVIKDALWFFGAYRRIDSSTGIARTETQLRTLRALEPSFEPFDLENKAHVSFAKLTTRAFGPHRLSGFYQNDKSRMDFGGPDASKPSSDEIGGHAIAARVLSVWTPALTSELGLSYNNKTYQTAEIRTDEPARQVYRSLAMSSGRWLGTDLVALIGAPGSAWSRQPGEKVTLSYDVTYLPPQRLGAHEVKLGAYLQPYLRNASTVHYILGGQAVEQVVLRHPTDPAAGVRPFRRSAVPPTRLQYDSVGSNYAGYVQDVWRFHRFTTTLGLRVDRVVYRDRIFDVETQNSVDLGPRFGVQYALTAEARSLARFTWTRVPDRVAGASFAASVTATETRSFDLDLDGTFETVDIIPGSTSLPRNRLFDSSLHQPYVNEFTVGYRQQLPGHMTLDAAVIRRAMKDRFLALETNGVYQNARFVGYADESQNEIYAIRNNDWNWPVYTALELTATKRTQRIELIASYTRQWQRLEGTWEPNDPASVIQPDAFANNRGIGPSQGSTLTSLASSLSGSTQALTSQGSPWQDHLVRAGITITGAWGLSGALNYTFQSGPWSGPIVTRLSAPDPAFGPATVGLSNGRAVPNPLATVVRFAYPTRADGQFHLDPLHMLNLRVMKTVAVGTRQIAVGVDLFNATNGDTDQGLASGGNVLGGANYRLTASKQTPRAAQLSVRVSF